MASVIAVSIREDAKQVKRALRGIKGGREKVLTRALNKTIRPVQTAAVRGIAKDMRIKQKDVRKAIRLQRANYAHLNAYIEASGKRLPLIAFGARQTRRGVSYKSWGGGRKTVPGAFIARMPSGHRGVFIRYGNKRRQRGGRYAGRMRQPIDELKGASIPRVFLRQHIERAMRETAKERWQANIRHELEYFLSKL